MRCSVAMLRSPHTACIAFKFVKRRPIGRFFSLLKMPYFIEEKAPSGRRTQLTSAPFTTATAVEWAKTNWVIVVIAVVVLVLVLWCLFGRGTKSTAYRSGYY